MISEPGFTFEDSDAGRMPIRTIPSIVMLSPEPGGVVWHRYTRAIKAYDDACGSWLFFRSRISKHN